MATKPTLTGTAGQQISQAVPLTPMSGTPQERLGVALGSGLQMNGNILDIATLSTQGANTFWAGPSSGLAAVPTFRAMTIDDLPRTTYAVATDQSVNNTTTTTAVADFTGRAIGVAETWLVEVDVTFVSAAASGFSTTGIKLELSTPSGTSSIDAVDTVNNASSSQDQVPLGLPSTTGIIEHTAAHFAADDALLSQSPMLTIRVRFRCVVVNGLTAGTLSFKFAQSTADATNLTIKRGGFIRYTRIA